MSTTLYKDFRNFKQRVKFNRNRQIDWNKDTPKSITWLKGEEQYDRKDTYGQAWSLLSLKQSIARACRILHPEDDHVVNWGDSRGKYATDFQKDPIAIYLSGGTLNDTSLRFGFRTDIIFGGAMHEICHVHYTKLWQKVIDKKDKLYHNLCNTIEDERIERLMRKELVGFGEYLDAIYQGVLIDRIHLTQEERDKEKTDLDNYARKRDIVFKYVRMPQGLTKDDLAYTDEITGVNVFDTLEEIFKTQDLLKEKTVHRYVKEIIEKLFRANDEQKKECEDHGQGEGQGDTDLEEILEQIKQQIKEQMKDEMTKELTEQIKQQILEDSKDENGDPTVSEEDAEQQAKEKAEEIVNAKDAEIDEQAEKQAQASIKILQVIDEISDKEVEGIDATVKEEMDAIEERQMKKFNVEDMESKVAPYTIRNENARRNESKYQILKSQVAKQAQAMKRQLKFRDSIFKREITNRKEGKINRRKLWTVNTSDPRPFKTTSEKKANKVDIAVLMDMSGSMGTGKYSKMWKCQQVATLFAEAFKDVQSVNMSIYGHTTVGDYTSYSGARKEEILLLNYFSNQNKRLRPDTLGYVPEQCNNVDGYAIEKVGEFLHKNRTGNKQVLIVISDGQPCAANYSGRSSIDHTRRMTNKLKNRLHQTVIQVAIEGSVPSEKMFDHFVKFTDMGTLVRDMSALVKKIIK